MTLYDELIARGLIAQVTNEEEIKNMINNGKATFYIGFDCTADSLTAGHFMALTLMKRLQMAGNKPIALIGGGTTMIGDPSGRTDMRKMLTKEDIAHNAACFKKQMEKFIDFSEGKALMLNNADWLLNLNYVELLRDVGACFSVNNMLRAKCYEQRMEKGLSFLEFNYMIMQSYDFYYMFQHYGCNMQFGGDDQWSNMLGGTELIRRKLGKDAYAMTITLLTDSQGKKMGKTAGNAVWLDPNKTSPFEFYQYWRNVGDADVLKCIRMLTFLPLEQIDEMDHWEGEQLNKAKEILAYELTKMVHGEEEAEKAQATARGLFSGAADHENMPSTKLDPELVKDGGVGLLAAMVAAGLCCSNREARQLVQQGGVLVDGFGALLETLGAPDWLRVMLANGIGGGIQTVATFIPVVFFLFFFLAILEDSGYMARAAFVMDRLMRALGLPGKAFVPLLVGFGCNVPAIMATRTMDRASDRIITIMMAPFMSCGARLPVYVLFATAFFPTNGQNLVFGLYLIGILAAVVTGLLLKRIALPGAASAFVMEIPPYHIPAVKGVMLRTWDRLKGFVLRAGRVIVVIVACLSILNSMGTDGTWGHEDTNESVLSEIGRTIVPVLEPMGVSEENWPAAVGIFTGVLAKEAVVGTMNSLYDSMARAKNAENGVAEEASEDEAGWSFGATLVEALESVRTNLADLGGALLDPAGIHVDDLSDTAAAAEEQEVAVDTIDMMQQLFGGGFAAFCYLLMVLLYMPCGAAVATVWREAGTAWTLFLCGWTTALGYTSATIVYRLGTFAENPTYSIVAIALSVAILAGMLLWMRTFAKKNGGKGRKVIPIYATR